MTSTTIASSYPQVINDIDDIYKLVGNGRYQLAIVLLCCLATFPVGVPEFIIFFVAYNPGWQCVPESKVCWYNHTILQGEKHYDERCRMNRSEWDYPTNSKFSIVTEFDLHCDKEFWIYTSSTVLYLGNLFGAILLGWVADRFGRSRVIFYSSTMVIVTSLLTSFVNNIWLFEILRFTTGWFISGTYMIMAVLATESVSENLRVLAGMMLWNFYPAGIALSGVVATYVRDWRMLLVWTTGPYMVILVFLWFLPESFIWLHANGKKEELMNELHRIARYNKKALPTDMVIKFPQEITSDTKKKNGLTIFHLFKPLHRLKVTLPMVLCWLSIGLIYVGIELAADNITGDSYRDFILLIVVDIPAIIAAIYCTNKLGRRVSCLLSMVIGGLSIFVVGFIPKNTGIAFVRLILGIVGKFFINLAFAVLVTWCAELYPTNIRTLSNAFLNSTAIIGGMCAPWVAVWLRQLHEAIPFFTMGGLVLLASITSFGIPETKGRTLPQDLNGNEVHPHHGNHLKKFNMEMKGSGD